MKQWIALIICAVLFVSVACPVLAETDGTTTVDPVMETTTEPTADTTTEPTADTTTEPTADTTTEPTVETTTTAPARQQVTLTIAYENGEIVIRAKDKNGQPVRNAPVKVAADSSVFTGQTNDGGVAIFPMAEEPAQIICSTEAFKGTIFYYDAAVASVILHEPTTAPTTDITTLPPTSTTATSPSTGTSVTWTTSDPANGEITATETVPTASTTAVSEEPGEPQSALPNGLALAMMIMGAVLLIVAAVVLCLFIFRAPRVPVEEEEEPKAKRAHRAAEEPAEESEEPEQEIEEAESAEAEPAGNAISLEDLFRDR